MAIKCNNSFSLCHVWVIISHWVCVPKSSATIQNYVGRISLIVSGTKSTSYQLRPPAPDRPATSIHTMDKDVCFETTKNTENNLVLSKLSINNKRAIRNVSVSKSTNKYMLAVIASISKFNRIISVSQNARYLQNNSKATKPKTLI